MAGFHWIFDFILVPFLLVINLLLGIPVLNSIAHILRYPIALFARSVSRAIPAGFELVVHTETHEIGNPNSEKRQYSIFVTHPKPYDLTALCGVVILKQCLAKKLPTGYSVVGTVVEPQSFVHDLVVMGASVELRRNNAKKSQ